MIRQIIRQPGSTYESRAVMQVALMTDIPVQVLPIELLHTRAKDLSTGEYLPIGSVEYVRKAMEVAEIPEPIVDSYPAVLEPFFFRNIERIKLYTVPPICFVKPVRTKLFNGFVFNMLCDRTGLNEHDREQHNIFMTLLFDRSEEEIWVSEPVTWLSEVRYYVLNGRVIGQGRYDSDGADDAPLPDIEQVETAVQSLVKEKGPTLTCALDMGVLSTGETALVEVNDAWALGLYGGDQKPSPFLYLEMLITRWQQIVKYK